MFDEDTDIKLRNITCPFCSEASQLQLMRADEIPSAGLSMVHYRDVAYVPEEPTTKRSVLEEVTRFLFENFQPTGVKYNGSEVIIDFDSDARVSLFAQVSDISIGRK